MIYGSYGYTGELITQLAAQKKLRPILAGRTEARLKKQAAQYDLPYRAFALDDPTAMADALKGVEAVVHCAGPFSHTAKPMAKACLQTHTHYLDITGEITVFERLARLDKQAKEAGIMVLPGIGFDVVPTDCVAADLKARLPDATHLELAFWGLGRASRGTMTTMVENIHPGGAIRKDGKIKTVPAAWKTKTIDFGPSKLKAVSIPWGDVSTAFHSTGIPNIIVYSAFPEQMISAMKIARLFGWLLQTGPLQRLLKARIQKMPPGPTSQQRQKGASYVWGLARNEATGETVTARLKTPDGYTLTALSAIHAVEKVLHGDFRTGFRSPSLAFGKDYVFEIEGVEKID